MNPLETDVSNGSEHVTRRRYTIPYSDSPLLRMVTPELTDWVV
jgi:hypothetical protein